MSERRELQSSAAGGRPADYFLDKSVAHKLSSLTECRAPELPEAKVWLTRFVLNNAFIAPLAPETRAYAFNFLRRAEAAFASYRSARSDLIEYLQTPRNVVSPYFRALLNFEICVAQTYQAFELLATAGRKKVFDPNDGSKEERLHRLYIRSKHMDRMIDGGQIPTNATAALWITNEGLECKGSALLFEELVALLNWIAEVADRISKYDFGDGSAQECDAR
jgi:hypothetical protein